MFECDIHSSQYSDEEMILIQNIPIFSSVPKLEIDVVPGWFVPPHEFDVNASSFSKGSYGSVHRGTWNGTNVVIKSPFLLPKGFIISVRTIKWFIAILSATTSWLTQTEK